MLEDDAARTPADGGHHRGSVVPSGLVAGEVERLPGVGGWHVLRLGAEHTPALRPWARRGFVPVTATLRGSTWRSSLMPMGDGTLFLALPAAVRRAEDVLEGDEVSARWQVRPAGRVPPAAPREPVPVAVPRGARRRDRW